MKIAIAQIKSDPADFSGNQARILKYLEQARAQQANLVVFPEAVVCGYAHLDLIHHPDFVKDCQASLEVIASAVKSEVVVLGFVRSAQQNNCSAGHAYFYNSVAVLHEGKVVAVCDKTLLPDYDIFSEKRYFLSGQSNNYVEVAGLRLGLGICEDMWDCDQPNRVYGPLLKQGADFLINISASPFEISKQPERLAVIQNILKGSQATFIYANLVGSYDGYDGEVVFDGRSLVLNQTGQVLAEAVGFTEQLLLVDSSAKPAPTLTEPAPEQELYQALVFGIQEYFRRSHFQRAYVGLSGGIDSAVVAALCVAALGKENVIGLTMPSHITSQETLSDARQLAQNLGIKCLERSIRPEFEAWEKEFKIAQGKAPASLTKQNKQARLRGALLMEYSNEDTRGIVVSTGNKTELALGYCTLYGDMCGGFAAISDVSKARVYALARFINQTKEIIPLSTIDRIPTAELEVGQTDAANLPGDYDVISPLVEAIVDDQATLADLIKVYPEEIVKKTFKLVHNNEFKRRQAAPGIRVTRKAFGLGRRIPMSHTYLK